MIKVVYYSQLDTYVTENINNKFGISIYELFNYHSNIKYNFVNEIDDFEKLEDIIKTTFKNINKQSSKKKCFNIDVNKSVHKYFSYKLLEIIQKYNDNNIDIDLSINHGVFYIKNNFKFNSVTVDGTMYIDKYIDCKNLQLHDATILNNFNVKAVIHIPFLHKLYVNIPKKKNCFYDFHIDTLKVGKRRMVLQNIQNIMINECVNDNNKLVDIKDSNIFVGPTHIFDFINKNKINQQKSAYKNIGFLLKK